MLTIKQIENKIDPVVLQHIKDNSYDKKLAYGPAEFIEKTKFGNRYISKTYWEKTLNQEKYETQVREYYLNNLQKGEELQKKKQRKRPEKGKNITITEFAYTLFRNYFEHRKGEIYKNSTTNKSGKIEMNSFVMNFEKETRLLEEKNVVKSVEAFIKALKKYKYFIPNLFISHKYFTKELLALLGVIVLDFDLDDKKVVMTKNELRLFIKKRIKVEPNLIWDTPTKGNYAAAISIEKMAGTPKSVHLYEQVVKEIIFKLDNLADAAASNANHSFSAPSNDKKTGRFVRKYNDDIHSIDEFRWLLVERDERREKERKVIDFKEESFKKVEAVEALLNGEVLYRDNGAFTAALVYRWLKKTEFECENLMLSQWLPNVQSNESFDHPYTKEEMMKCIRHAYSGKYRNFKSIWIEICTGIHCNVNGYFQWRTYENQGKYIMDTETRLREFFKKNGCKFEGNIKEMAQELNVSVRSLERHIAALRENNEIVYFTKRGRGAKTTFYYTEPQQLNFDSVLKFEEYTYDEEIEALNELDQLMEQKELG